PTESHQAATQRPPQIQRKGPGPPARHYEKGAEPRRDLQLTVIWSKLNWMRETCSALTPTMPSYPYRCATVAMTRNVTSLVWKVPIRSSPEIICVNGDSPDTVRARDDGKYPLLST